jgi:EAL domain-containing protein (putative c-di-GMP-specific phosphodiesterase class I)
LRAIRARDLDLPVILLTAVPSVQTAAAALEYGAFRYLTKPVDPAQPGEVVERAIRSYRLAQTKRDALALLGQDHQRAGDRAGLEAGFERALGSLWMAFQPIVSRDGGRLFAYEALTRSDEKTLPHPGALFDAAQRLGRMHELSRAVRARAAAAFAKAPPGVALFVNLEPHDLLDPSLTDPLAPLAAAADRVVLEITERASLDEISDLSSRIASLRARGYRIAVDDLGAGYAGLSSFLLLQPDIVKLDMSLVRGCDADTVKRRLIRSMVSLCEEMNIQVVAEGVETRAELQALLDLGCHLLQGYLLGRPSRPFPAVCWPSAEPPPSVVEAAPLVDAVALRHRLTQRDG